MVSSISLLYCLAFYILCQILRWLVIPLIFRSPFHDVPGPLPKSWIMGNLGQLFNAKGLPFHQYLSDHYGGMVKVYGFFGDEQLYISDPMALQSILLKFQDAFEETSVFIETNKAIFGPGLVATIGDQHKRQRKLMYPAFSVGKLRQLTPIIYDIADKLMDVLTRQVGQSRFASNESVLDMSEWMSRVSLEMVGQTVLGYSFDPLDSPHNNAYTSAVKELIPTLFGLSLIRQFAPFISKLGSPSFRRKLVEWTPNRTIQKVKNMSDVMHNKAIDILQRKRAAISAEVDGSDIISVLLRDNARASEDEKLSDLELTGQMTVLVFGAQDTTSATLSRILYMLSLHQEIQGKIQDEIRAAYSNRGQTGDNTRLSYDEVTSLPWLDAVLKETLRLYPPVPFVRRTSIKETTIPYSRSRKCIDDSAASLSTITVPANTTIFVSIAGSNRLESVWGPDAAQWKPERWFLDNKPNENCEKRLPGIYSGMMSFLGGGRACIGYKFAQIEMKILLVTLLSRFRFSPSKENIVWNLSQIISPSVQKTIKTEMGTNVEESKGLPLVLHLQENFIGDP